MPSSSIQLPLKDKLGIVTGANRGIGLAIIRKLASQGCNLITLTREIDEGFIEETKNLSSNFGITVDMQKFDLTNNDTIVQLIKHLTTQKLKIDIFESISKSIIYPPQGFPNWAPCSNRKPIIRFGFGLNRPEITKKWTLNK
jgi:enoyl-[acyl-carrier-protein] reductase (NADH)